MNNYLKMIMIALTSSLFSGSNLLAQSKDEYIIHPPSLTVPSNDNGEVVRSISQFKKWTLLCDQNKKMKTLLCNVTQLVSRRDGVIVFDWSLAATDDGQAYLIIRTMANAKTDDPMLLYFKELDKPVGVKIASCNKKECLGQTRVGRIIGKQIEKSSEVTIFKESGQSLRLAE